MKSLRTLRPYIRAYRWHFIFGIFFVFASNFFATKVPVQVGNGVNIAEAGSVRREDLAWLAGYIVVLAGLGASFRFLMRRVMIDASREIEFHIRNDFFRKLQKLDPAFYDANNTGDLMSRGTNDMDAVRMFIGPSIMYMANALFSLPLILGQMVYLDWRLTAISLTPMIILPPLVLRFGRETHKRSREQQDEFGVLTTYAQENLAGIQVVKAYRQEDAQVRGFGDRNNAYMDKSLRVSMIQSIFFPAIRCVVGLGFIVLLVAGGNDVISGKLQIGTLIAMILLFGMVVWPMIAVGWVINLAQRGIASLERINEVLEAEPAVTPTSTPQAVSPRPAIEFRDLTFTYPATNAPQLEGISVNVPYGTTVGIIGPVGSGKSTLVHLLARFYDIERGKIFFGGVDINDIDLRELRRRTAFVFQETFLFSDTIEWNIRFGAVSPITEEDVLSAAKRAHLDSEVERLPERYRTELGERGINLSGGQRQRLSIARALARESEILVFDDALSAVDTHTEEAILGELRGLLGGRTVFLISHRISTVSLADIILVIEDGRITQRGTHQKLIGEEGLYARLHEKQLLEQSVEQFDETDAVAPSNGAHQ